MPILYSFPPSQPCRTVTWFMAYADLKEIEVKNVNLMKGEHKAPEFIAKFPNGQIPAFEDGDFCFGESTAILLYIADGHALMPTDKKERTRLMEYFGHHSNVARRISKDYMRVIFYAKSAEELAEKKDAAFQAIVPVIEKFEALLGKQDFILGGKLSLADFLFAPEIDQVEFVKPGVYEKYPNITKYLARLHDEVNGYTANCETAGNMIKGLLASRGY